MTNKTLTEMIDAFKPLATSKKFAGTLDDIPIYNYYVDRASYDKLKAAAILLSKCVEKYAFEYSMAGQNARESIVKAKDILGGE